MANYPIGFIADAPEGFVADSTPEGFVPDSAVQNLNKTTPPPYGLSEEDARRLGPEFLQAVEATKYPTFGQEMLQRANQAAYGVMHPLEWPHILASAGGTLEQLITDKEPRLMYGLGNQIPNLMGPDTFNQFMGGPNSVFAKEYRARKAGIDTSKLPTSMLTDIAMPRTAEERQPPNTIQRLYAAGTAPLNQLISAGSNPENAFLIPLMASPYGAALFGTLMARETPQAIMSRIQRARQQIEETVTREIFGGEPATVGELLAPPTEAIVGGLTDIAVPAGIVASGIPRPPLPTNVGPVRSGLRPTEYLGPHAIQDVQFQMPRRPAYYVTPWGEALPQPLERVPEREKVMGTPIIGEQPKPQQVLTPEMFEQIGGTIVPETRGTVKETPLGGQIGFAGEGIPSAGQAAEMVPANVIKSREQLSGRKLYTGLPLDATYEQVKKWFKSSSGSFRHPDEAIDSMSPFIEQRERALKDWFGLTVRVNRLRGEDRVGRHDIDETLEVYNDKGVLINASRENHPNITLQSVPEVAQDLIFEIWSLRNDLHDYLSTRGIKMYTGLPSEDLLKSLPKLIPGERLAMVQRQDGSTYPVSFGDKFWEHPTRGRVPSIGRPVEGEWSHGLLGPDEKLMEIQPSGGQNAIPELRPNQLPQAQPPIGVQAVEGQVRRGAGAEGAAREEVQGQTQGDAIITPALREVNGNVWKGSSHDLLRRHGLKGDPGYVDENGNFLTLTEVARLRTAGHEGKGSPVDIRTARGVETGVSLIKFGKETQGELMPPKQVEAASRFAEMRAAAEGDVGVQQRAAKEEFRQATEQPPTKYYSGLPSEELFTHQAIKLLASKFPPTANLDKAQILNTLRNKLGEQSGEWKMWKELGIEKALPQKVSTAEATKWMQENGPRVEVRKFGEGAIPDWQRRYNQLTHEVFDSKTQQGKYDLSAAVRGDITVDEVLFKKWGLVADDANNAKEIARTREYVELAKRAMSEVIRGSQANWSQVAPKPESDMPGYVEIAVVKPEYWNVQDKEAKLKRLDELEAKYENDTITPREKLEKDNLHNEFLKGRITGTQFPSSHNFPPNTLGWVRGYMETLPSGEKAFHIIEVQSDWGQQRREIESRYRIREYPSGAGWAIEYKNNRGDWTLADREMTKEKAEARRQEHLAGASPTPDPLLAHYERLALKAAIEHARKEGATKVVISDAETAMMSEGHDVGAAQRQQVHYSTRTYSLESAERELEKLSEAHPQRSYRIEQVGNHWEVLEEERGRPEIDQEPGMRLHYDTILPRIMEELTGEKGEKVTLGGHKNAFEGTSNYNVENFPTEQAARQFAQEQGLRNPVILEDVDRGRGFYIQRHKVQRQNLIFRTPEGKPKTDVSGMMYDISKVSERRATGEPFTQMGKMYSGIPLFDPDLWGQSKEQVKEMADKMAAVLAKRQQGESPLAEIPLPPTADAAVKSNSSLRKRIIAGLTGHGVDRPLDETMRAFAAKQMGWSAPRHVAANEELGNKLVRFASARIAAGQEAKATVSEVLGDKYKDPEFSKRLGAVAVEERLEALRRTNAKKSQELANQVKHVWEIPGSPFKSEAEYQAALRDPEIREKLNEHIERVQKPSTAAHVALGGTLDEPGPNTGAFVNLIAMLEDDNAFLKGGSRQGQVSNVRIKPSVFEHEAKGTAKAYEFDYRTIAERMVKGNYERVALLDLYKAYVDSGVGKIVKSGERPPEVGGQPMEKVTIKTKFTPWGRTAERDLWLRKDLLPEFHQAMQTDSKVMKAGTQLLMDLATELQIVGPTDFVFHTANMYASVAYDLGAKTTLGDLVRGSVLGARHIDALGRIGYNLYKAFVEHPETQRELADIAKIGALRGEHLGQSMIARIPGVGKYLDTGRLIRLFDRAGRLARNQMFDNLVERGLVKDTELDRREFINKMGQYNERLMSKFQAFQRQYFSQFVVAGRTFNRNAFQRIFLMEQARHANPAAYWKMKLLNTHSLLAALFVTPVLANLAITGKPFGRPGTLSGNIDTGKDGPDGRPIQIDLLQTTLLRRGMRITGIQAAEKGIRAGKPLGQIAADAGRDIANGLIHPWAGPPTRIGYTAMTGKELGFGGRTVSDDPKNIGDNLLAALEQVNPFVTGMVEGAKEKTGVVKTPLTRLASAIGYKFGAYPTHTELLEKETGKPVESMAMRERLLAERTHKKAEEPQTAIERAKGAEQAIANELKRGQELLSELDKPTRRWVESRGLRIPGYDNKLRLGGTDVYLTKAETDKLHEYVKQEYVSTIKMFQERADRYSADKMPVAFNNYLIAARQRARGRLLKEIKLGSRSENEQH